MVTHQVNGRSVYTVVSQQSLENQITLAILNGEMTVDEAPGLVRAMRALNSNSMENLRESESALSTMLVAAIVERRSRRLLRRPPLPRPLRQRAGGPEPARRGGAGLRRSSGPGDRRERGGSRRGSGGVGLFVAGTLVVRGRR